MPGPPARTQPAPADGSPPSKTQRKRASLALQELGEQLAQLSDEELSRLPLSEPLLEAIRAVRRIAKFGALRRQLQYIGRLMHEVDAQAVAAQLRAWQRQTGAARAQLHRIEGWRARLLQDDSAVAELAREFPGCDTGKLLELVHSARREQLEGRPPRSFRNLFRELRRIVPSQPGPTE